MRAIAPGGVGLPGLCVLAGRYDRGGTSGGDGVMALAGVEGTIGGDACDPLIGGDSFEQFGQHGRVADIAGGELRRPNF